MLISAAWATPGLAQNDKVQRGPVPAWVVPSDPMPVPDNAAGLVFVRNQDTLVHFDAKGQVVYNSYRIRILHANALQLGNLSLAWSPSSGAPVVHMVKVHRGSETIDVLAKTGFEILRREDQLEAAMLTGTLTAVLRVPDLRVGDEVEFAATIRMTDPTLGNRDAGVLLLHPQPSPGRIRLGLSWIDSHQPNVKMTPDMAKVAQKGDRTMDFRFENPPMLVPPKSAPARYQWQRIVEYSDFADWATISRHFAPLYQKAAALSGDAALKREVDRIAGAHATAMERASAALKLVQQDVRYIYVGLDGGNLRPATASETWQRRYGDCKGKTALLLGMLAALGIEAEAVLANNSGGDDGLDERLPSPRMFDHVLVRARIDGKLHYLDGTLPPVAPPVETPVLPYRWVLPLTAGGSTIERLEWKPATTPDSIDLYEIDARDGFDKPARITSTTIVRGLKGLEAQVQLSGLTAAQLLDGVRQKMIGDSWDTIEDVQWRYDQKARASVLKIVGTRTVDWDDDGNGARSMALPGGGFSPPDKRLRPADQDQKIPYYQTPGYTCHVTTVRIPIATQPRHWSFKPGYDTRIFGTNYHRAFDLRDGSIRMVRAYRVEQPEIDAASALADNARIAAFDNSMGWVFYNPASKAVVVTGKRVPTTDEIDWTADQVPCLAPAKAP